MIEGPGTQTIVQGADFFPHRGQDGRREAADFIAAIGIQPHYHPIVDLFSASVLGFEVLSRGVPPLEKPREMFAEARRLGMTWELEKACRTAALREIVALPDAFRGLMYFINVSPDIFNDPRFVERFTQTRLQELGIDQRQIVIEITEDKSFNELNQFGSLIAHYAGQGFKIALDDFGSGYSGLINLIVSTPHYLKLDMAIVRDVHKHDYKQKLVKAFAAFASSVNARLIAEGVEQVEELETLIRYGVRYAQGFLFGMPQREPCLLAAEWRERLREMVERFDLTAVELDERVGTLVIRPLTIARHSMRCQELDLLFKNQRQLDHVVLLDRERVAGIITRQHFYAETGGAFGYQLLQKKPVDAVVKNNPLIVNEKMPVTTMAKLAMERIPEDLYDPVLVLDDLGSFLGTVTMKQVMTKSVELEIRSALGVNPLTNLPGNNAIHRWIHDALRWEAYAIIYVDLDQFKGFNDTYGFLMGDEMLCFTAEFLSRWLERLPQGARLGHIGGDDYVIVNRGIVAEQTLAALCQDFDREKNVLFKSRDIERGYIEAADRQGKQIRMPLVTMSLAVIDSERIWHDPHPALFSEVSASLKKEVKRMTAETGKSGFLIERRMHL